MRRQAFPLIAVAVVAAALLRCGGSSPVAPAAQPLPAPPAPPTLPGSLPGVWTGYLRAALCFSFGCEEVETIPFVLRVAADGSGYVGAFELEAASSMNVNMDVTGAVQPDGAVLFTGHRDPWDGDSASVELRKLLVRVDPSAGLSGDIDLRKFYTGNATNRSLEGTVASASFLPLPFFAAQGVSGRWSGTAVIRGCSGYCPLYRDAGDAFSISMVLGQSGTSVTGQLQLGVFAGSQNWLPIAGNASPALSLSSERVVFSSGNDKSRYLESFDATLDGLGRINGRFTYASDSTIAISPFNVFFRLECEILWLKRDP